MTGSALDDDLAAEGEPEREFNPGIAARLPRKTTAGGALIRNADGLFLFLEPTYKPTLEIPGGIAEHNESPRDACLREVTEEIGLTIDLGNLLVVDWRPAQGVSHDGLMFIFDGGQLDDAAIAAVNLDTSEVRAHEFMTLDEATPRLRPSMARRLSSARSALDADTPVYAQFGRPQA